ncbi:MAG: hypothetical protein IPL19_21090 [Sandaracinaceae bacterium]|nr:hypothetical protein [Sandaracinaceae bacterium]
MNDCLEHIAFPEKTLCALIPKLCDGGVFLISVPNVRQFYNLWHVVVDADWKYQQSGILDRTHLRFYTMRSLRRFLVDELGFELEYLRGITPIVSRGQRLLSLVTFGKMADTRYTQIAAIARPTRGR